MALTDGIRDGFTRVGAEIKAVRAEKSNAAHTHAAAAVPASHRLLRVLLATRDSGPRPLVYCGSSTTAGSNATAEARRYVNLLTAALQAAFPLRTGAVSPAMRTLSQAAGASLTAGVQGVNAGVGGTTASNYLTSTTRGQIAGLAPTMILHMVGSNDYASKIAVATYKANVRTQIDALDSAISTPHVHVLVQPYERGDVTNPAAPWSAYGTALRELADADLARRLYLDISEPYTAAGVPSPDPLDLLDTDLVHQTDAGHAAMAELLRDALGVQLTTAAISGGSSGDTTAPSVPTGLIATPGNAQVVLDWTDATDNVGVTGYRVRRGGALVGSPSASAFTDTGLTNGTAYSYTVAAMDAAGNESAQTAAVSATPSSGAGGGALVSDSFTRADSATSMGTAPTGQAWAPQTGTWGISANRAYNTSTGASVTTLIETGVVNHDATCVINQAAGTFLPGLVVRGLDDGNRWGGYLHVANDRVQIYRATSGATTMIVDAPLTLEYNVDYTVRVTAIADVISVYVNGTLIVSHTMSSADATKFTGASYSKVGFRGNTDTRWDTLAVNAA